MSIEELYLAYLSSDGVSTDTRDALQNKIFFALKGDNFDGNTFAQQAIDNGAKLVVVDGTNLEGDKILKVEDSLHSLQQLGLYHRRQLGIPVLAITGSNGKTTTKELCHAVMSSQYKTTATKGNLNNHIGIPLSLLSIPTDTQFAIIEMGANHLGEIKSYCEYVEPNIGLITNCGKAHLEGFGSMEGVRKGKGELYDYLRAQGGRALVNTDHEYLIEMSQGLKQTSYGAGENCDVRGELLSGDPFLKLRYDGQEIETQLSGSYNFDNVMAAICLGVDQGIETDKIDQALSNYSPSNARSQVIMKEDRYIILDAYNANPSSMTAALENFRTLNKENKIACIGGMMELGDTSIEEHQKVVDELASMNLYLGIVVGVDFAKTNNGNLHYFETSDEAGKFLASELGEEKVAVLIKGSRATKMENILNYL